MQLKCKFGKKYFCSKIPEITKYQYKFSNNSNGDVELEKNKDISHFPYIYQHSEFKNYPIKTYESVISEKYDAVIVGGGHNGLICANYLAKSGKKVLVVEKRHIVGGAANSEELVEGYKLSRCSYVLALFRKRIINELFGDDFYKKIKLYKRNPKGFIPTKEDGVFLRRFNEKELFVKEIAKFSQKDSENYVKLDQFLTRMVKIIDPMIDLNPPNAKKIFSLENLPYLKTFLQKKNDLSEFYHFLTASAQHYLDMYLENDLLKGYYATDAVIGAMKSPLTPGSAYVLLHHVMGDLDEDGNWFYVEGGNGTVSRYISDKAVERGVDICLNSPVERLIIKDGKVEGIVLKDGKEIKSKITISAMDMHNTYFKLLNEEERCKNLSPDFIKCLNKIDYNSPVFKINLIVNKLPKFNCLNKILSGNLEYSHFEQNIAPNYFPGTIHMNSESIKSIDDSYIEALSGVPSSNPMIEMTIPSILDKSLVPKNSGHHVIGLFCQYAPYKLRNGEVWTEEKKKDFSQKVYSEIDKYAAGFSQSILFEDLLSPYDLEKQFSLTGGNIFHGSMDIHSISFCRPTLNNSDYKQPIENLFACSSAMHPGGGVMGAPGRNCALIALKNLK